LECITTTSNRYRGSIGFSKATSIDACIDDGAVTGLYNLKFVTIFSPIGCNEYVNEFDEVII
jgi:hypothetical protein